MFGLKCLSFRFVGSKGDATADTVVLSIADDGDIGAGNGSNDDIDSDDGSGGDGDFCADDAAAQDRPSWC